MPQVHFVKKARKAHKAGGIEKGESYYWWAFMVGGRGGPKHYSKTRPKPSQLTRSEFWGSVYSIQEDNESVPGIDDIESQRDNVVQDLQNVLDETQGKYDNLPDGLQQGQSGEQLQGRVDAVQEAIDTLESIDCSVDEKEEDETDDDFETRKSDRADEIWQEVTEALGNISCD